MRNFRKFAYCFLGALVIISLLTSSSYSMWNQRNKPALAYGVPAEFIEDLNINTINIDQIVDDDSHLYLLDAHEGVLRVFDLDGNYLHTRMFYDYANGAFKLAVKDRCLYVSDPHSNVYVFVEGEFSQFVERENAKNILGNIDFEKSSTKYVIKTASVWEVCETGDICVIERPLYSVLWQRRNRIAIIVGLGFVFALIYLLLNKRKK